MAEIRTYLSIVDEMRFRVSGCWLNINGKGSYNAPHIHGNSFFSGVYYVRTPPGCGLIEFREPSRIRENLHRPTTVLTSFKIRNQEADLGRAPAYLEEIKSERPAIAHLIDAGMKLLNK